VFVALARLTAEPDPVPLQELVSVQAAGPGEVHVRWSAGREVRVRLDENGVGVTPC
jgi:hypothetical protein